MKPLFLIAGATLALTLLPSCGASSGRVDARNPSISQMDDLDVQWGLPRRTSRGTPRRLYQSLPGDSAMDSSAPALMTSPSPTVQAQSSAAAQPQAPVTVDPSVINKLR